MPSLWGTASAAESYSAGKKLCDRIDFGVSHPGRYFCFLVLRSDFGILRLKIDKKSLDSIVFGDYIDLMKIDYYKLQMQMAQNRVRNIDIAAREGKTAGHVYATLRNAKDGKNFIPATVGWIAHGIGCPPEDILADEQ